METPDFLKLLQHYPHTSLEEAEAVLSLKENFPFSQVLHTLSARVSKDHQIANSTNALQLAAVYSADRAVLKGLMEASGVPAVQPNAPIDVPVNKTGDVANAVLEDLAKLHALKENFEMLFLDGPVSTQTPPAATSTTDGAAENESVTLKSKKERIVQLAKSLTAVDNTGVDTEQGLKPRRRKKDALESFIDQIVVSKQELSPESEKHKEQLQVIDKFIKISPSITGNKDKQNQNDDLSTIKTGEFGDHIISETLVEILLKQGKKDKAVEVLKKLIWKFPQKKAYFAAQIEELKK